jgi:hypothetical protein
LAKSYCESLPASQPASHFGYITKLTNVFVRVGNNNNNNNNMWRFKRAGRGFLPVIEFEKLD